MIRNDYRRALILLRSAVKGMNGHVRLERRTLTGSMRFMVTGAGSSDNLRALLLRKGRDGWAASAMGSLHVDNRGQAGLTYSFDPRNIDGHALEDYPVVAVVRLGKTGAAEPVMNGFVNGTTEVDWTQAMAAARAMYRHSGQDASETSPEVRPTPVEPRSWRGMGVIEEPVGGLPDSAPLPEAEETFEPQPAEAEPQPPEAAQPLPAGQMLALDIAMPWPEAVEPLRALFQQLPPCDPFPADGYTFVCAPLPGNGRATSLVGVRIEDERPVAVCYGIPGVFAAEPPAGLDGYMWRGSGVNGWWVTFIDALTGEETQES
jgi:hypothetical protein